MTTRLGLAALFLLAAAAPSGALAADAQNPACVAALDVILSFAKRGKNPTPLVVAGTPDSQESGAFTIETLLQAGWTGDVPSQSLADAFLSLPPQSPLDACPGLQAELAKARITTGDDAVARVTAENTDIVSLPTYGADVLSLSLPIVSADGRDALLQDRLCEGPQACVGSIVHLQREKGGRWKAVSSVQSTT
jgi:hypothetical protein